RTRRRIQSLRSAGSVSVSLATCAVLDFADELRQARGDAQRALRLPGHRPTRAAIAAFLASRFTEAAGAHGTGYAVTRTATEGRANEGRRWHYRCGKCQRPVQRLYQPRGWTSWACAWCSGVGRPRFDRGHRWAEAFWLLARELDAATKRRGPRSRR